MARRIRPEDVQTVKERASLEEVVRDHVTLRGGGVGTLKGLCPFHDEKTPSFTVRPAVGYYHCFGCQEGGDVLDFMQKIDHLTFTESVERLADRLGITLRYDETGGGRGDQGPQVPTGQRTRLMEAHRVAEEFYHEALLRSAEGRSARDFMRQKGFGSQDCSRFMVGYSPNSGEALVAHLRAKGFTDEELVVGGLAGRGRGLYDRFRGRVMWPIRSIAGDTVGFGARRLYDDDRIAAKYLNTAETPIYKKTGVLYGLDLAKKAIATERRAVVVEGYTDVMAAHLSGVGTAVATCGTAFAADHITILRRILRDEAGQAPARVIFTFDGDAAGQKAAMKAFEQDQRWAAQSFVAVAEHGQDPNDLWLGGGPEAVQALVDGARPMFEFAVRTTLAPYDLGLAEERVQAMRAVAPIVAGIKDPALRPEYVREVAGWMGVDPTALGVEVQRAGQARATAGTRSEPRRGERGRPEPGAQRPDQPGAPHTAPPVPRPDLTDPVQVAERNLLQVALQYPLAIVAEDMDELPPEQLRAPMHRAVWHALQQAGGVRAAAGMSAATWNQAVLGQAPPLVHPLVQELAVAPLPTRLDPATGMPSEAYVDSLVLRVRLATLEQRIAVTLGQAQRQPEGTPEARRLVEELMKLQREHAALKDRMS